MVQQIMFFSLLIFTVSIYTSHGQGEGEHIKISRTVSLLNNITQEKAICGQEMTGMVQIEIDSEPGTERSIALKFEPNEKWVTIQSPVSEFNNEGHVPLYTTI